jgi:hypothetical protein
MDLARRYRRVFNSEDGKIILADLEKRCFGKHPSFDENPIRMAFNEGRRSVYLSIQTMLELDLKKLKEQEDASNESES